MICDDHALIIDGLRAFIHTLEDCNVVFSTSDGTELISYIENHASPDIVITDIRMPERINGFELVSVLKKRFPLIKIIVCSGINNKIAIEEMRAKGVHAFISKDLAAKTLKEVIEIVVNDGTYFSIESKGQTPESVKTVKSNRIFRILTDHELVTAKLLASDLTYSQIAEKLNITPSAVDNLRAKIFDKLNLHGRVGLTRYLQDVGIF